MYHFATIQNITDDDRQTDRRHTVPKAWPIVRSANQKGKTNLDLLEQEIVSGSSISCAICKSAPWSRHITIPASHHSVFYRVDALPAAQATASKHWRQILRHKNQPLYILLTLISHSSTLLHTVSDSHLLSSCPQLLNIMPGSKRTYVTTGNVFTSF